MKGIDGVIFVYNIDSTNSFLEVKKKFYKLVHSTKDVRFCPFILVGNKCDLDEDIRQVHYDQGLDFSKHMKAQFFESSASNGKNVERAFFELVKEISFIRTGGNAFPSELKQQKPTKSRSYNNTSINSIFNSKNDIT